MMTPVIKNVQTQAVGFAPILRYYFDRCAIANIIDDHVELDPRRKILTHGQAASGCSCFGTQSLATRLSWQAIKSGHRASAVAMPRASGGPLRGRRFTSVVARRCRPGGSCSWSRPDSRKAMAATSIPVCRHCWLQFSASHEH